MYEYCSGNMVRILLVNSIRFYLSSIACLIVLQYVPGVATTTGGGTPFNSMHTGSRVIYRYAYKYTVRTEYVQI